MSCSETCRHVVRRNDGRSVVCDDCDLVLEELPECSHTNVRRGHCEPTEMVCEDCAAVVGEYAPEIKRTWTQLEL